VRATVQVNGKRVLVLVGCAAESKQGTAPACRRSRTRSRKEPLACDVYLGQMRSHHFMYPKVTPVKPSSAPAPAPPVVASAAKPR
jgi:hypothetical protein